MTGTQLKRKRASLGLTQVDLAEQLDLKPNTVSRYETGLLKVPKVVELALETVEKRLTEQSEQAPKQSFAEAAAHLLGKHDFGPGDLATNKKHLEGLGRD